jgi:hypothetical protein
MLVSQCAARTSGKPAVEPLVAYAIFVPSADRANRTS